MNCPLCGTVMKVIIELSGGCSGHFFEDDRCYCDSPDAHAIFYCPNTKTYEYVNGKFNKRKNPCKQKNLKISELSDANSIGRWLSEHYTPSPNTKMIPK